MNIDTKPRLSFEEFAILMLNIQPTEYQKKIMEHYAQGKSVIINHEQIKIFGIKIQRKI